MTGPFATLTRNLAASRTARRRARNLKSRAHAPAARGAGSGWTFSLGPGWVWAALALVIGGAVALALHARALPSGAQDVPGAQALVVLQPLAPGLDFVVPIEAGVSLTRHGAIAMVIASGMRAGPAVRVDLCTQMLDPAQPRLLPLRVGYPFGEAAALARAGGAPPRTVLLAKDGSSMPRIDITGNTAGNLAFAWNAGAGTASWVSDATGGAITHARQGAAALGANGWLLWGGEALRFTRQPSGACPQAGELVLHHFQRGAPPDTSALVQAFPAVGAPVSLRLPAGAWHVPLAPGVGMEDQALFEALGARGLLRLGPDGLIEIAPRDLLAWLGADEATRAPLPGWQDFRLHAGDRRLLERLHHRADGAFVREQVRVFNSERRLVAWRVRPGSPALWQAAVAGSPALREAGLPLPAMRLFAALPQGWEPWSRVGGWDGGRDGKLVTLSAPAGGKPLELLVAGRVRAVVGATAVARGACDGRACPDAAAVQHLSITPLPGANTVQVEVEPLDLARMSGNADAAYRHVRIERGSLAWQVLPAGSRVERLGLAPVRLFDRNGNKLWQDGAPSVAATFAGLAPLLGVHRQHDGSVAGMLGRLGGGEHAANLTLDLALQNKAQLLLDCIGLMQGHWNGRTCVGAQAPPADRRAGLVLLDAGNGDILAAASSGGGAVEPGRWDEVRDFDRADPARSPLRIAAFQHDGGAHRAPGSTFKVITALGLEATAQDNQRLDAVLGGLPLAEVDRIAQDGGYDFRTGAPSYPAGGERARITNFRDQITGARAEGGRLGLAQAMAHSVNTWFAWAGEVGDRTLLGQPDGGMPGAVALEAGALDAARPVAAMAARLGFGQPLRLDGGLLPQDYRWRTWDALSATASQLDPVRSRHELRQMAIGLRMQTTPLQMALVAAAVGEGRSVTPRLLLALDGRGAAPSQGAPLGVRLDRVRAGMKGVVDGGTASGVFRGPAFDALRPGLYAKTGTAPAGQDDLATVWFMGYLEPGTLPGQTRRLAFAAFVSHSALTGGGHAAPVVAALLASMAEQSLEKRHK